MGTVRNLKVLPDGPSLSGAIDAFLDTITNPGTRRNYAGTLRALSSRLGDDKAVATLGGPEATAEISTWFVGRWGGREPATYNRNLDALRSAAGYWADEGWINGDPTANLRRRPRPADRTRALLRSEVDELLSGGGVALREKTLWRLLYETAARASEVLGLDVDDLDLRNRRARVRRKGGAVDIIVWQTGSARLLPRLLEG